jgi:outer membrane protein TolC
MIRRTMDGWTMMGAALLLMVGAPTAAGAQTGMSTDTMTLTLDAALSHARGTNPSYRQAVNSAGLNGAELRTTWFEQVLPRAQLNFFNTQFTGNRTTQGFDNFGNPATNPVSDWRYFSQTDQSLDLTWAIQGSSIFNALDRQQLTNLDRDIGETRALTALEIAVRRAYWDALEQRELMRAEEELVEARRVDQQVAERLFSLAMRTRVDILNAELGAEQQQLALRQQRAAFEKAKLSLRTTLGDEELGPFRLGDEGLPSFDPSGLNADELVRTALEVNPELRQAEVAVRTAGVEFSDSKRSWWPQLILNWQIARRVRNSETEALFDVSPNEDLDQQFYIGLRVPMFNNFFQNQQAIAQSSVALDNSREAERDTRLKVRESVQSALLELSNQYESLRLAERSGEIAAEALRLAQEEYRIGTRSFEDLRQAVESEADTRRQLIQGRYAFVDALLSLEEAVGARVTPAGGER